MPQMFFVSDYYWHHAIPLWNQFNGFGMPLLADPQSFVFSPLCSLFYLIPNMYVWNLTMVLKFLISAVSTYFLCLEFEFSAIAASATALLFTFCPWNQLEGEQLGNSNGICLTPIVFLFMIRAVKRKSLWHTVAAGVAIAIDLLSAHPEISFVTILFGCLLMCLTAFYDKHERIWFFPTAFRIVLAGLIAFGLSAPMLIPFGEFLLNADTYKFTCAGHSDMSLFGLLALYVYPFYRSGSIFLGPLSWFGTATAVMRCRSKDNRFIQPLLFCLAVSALFATKSFPLSLLFSVPPFLQLHSLYCLPTYILFLSLTSGIGIQLFMGNRIAGVNTSVGSEAQRTFVSAIFGSTLLFLAPIIFLLGQHNSLIFNFEFLAETARFAWKWWLVNALGVFVTVFASNIIGKFPSREAILSVSIVAVGTISLMAVSIESRPLKPAFSYPTNLSVKIPIQAEGRALCIGDHLLRPMTNLVYKVPILTTWNPLFPKGFWHFVQACGGLRTDIVNHTFTANISRLIDLAGVRTIVSAQPLLDECAADAVSRQSGKDGFAVKGVLYSDQLALNDIEVLRDSKQQTIFCRAKATPLKAGSYALCFDVRDTSGKVVSAIESQPIWNGLINQTVICSGALPTSCKHYEISIRVIDQQSWHAVPPNGASSGRICSDGSLFIGRSGDKELIKEVSNDRFKVLSTWRGITTYENKAAFDRSFLIRGIKWCRKKEDALEYVKLHADEMSKTVVLEEFELTQFRDAYSRINSGCKYQPATKFDDSGIIQSVTPRNQLTTESASDLDVNVPATSLMVTSDLDYPGWEASVDGVKSPIFRADSLFTAVLIPAGKHHIRFEYRPLSFLIGLVMCVSAFVVLLITFFWGWRERLLEGETSPRLPNWIHC